MSKTRSSIKTALMQVLLIVFGLLMGSCATAPTKPVPLVMLPTATQALNRLEERRLSVRSFRMEGEITLHGDRGEISGEHIIRGAYPNRLRAEVMGPFGRQVLLLISDGRWLSVLDHRNNKAYMGRASRRNLARMVGLNLSLESVYALLTGNVTVPPGSEKARLSSAHQKDLASLKLVYTGGEMDQSMLFDPRSYSLHKAVLRERGKRVDMEAIFEDFQKGVSYSYPLKMELKDRGGRTLVLSCDDLRINPQLNPDIFKPWLPKGVSVELLP